MTLRAVPKNKRAPPNPAYRDFIRGLPCVCWPEDPPSCGGYLNVSTKRYVTQACHLKSRGSGGGDEPGQLWPGCAKHHGESHHLGRKEFERRHGLNLKVLAGALWEQFQAERA